MSAAFTPAWLADAPAAHGFIPRDFRRAADRAAAVRDAARPLAPGVGDAWRAQEARRPQSPSRSDNLAALVAGDAVAVVTGQQAGLLTGPLYTVTKAASAVATARALEAETGRRCVPVFWLQTEDHDWREIDHCTVPASEGPRRIALADALGEPGARVSVAHRPLSGAIDDALAAMADALGTLPAAEDVLRLLRRHYRADAAPGEALGGVIAELFADAGLLVLDPRDPRDPALAAAAAPVHRRAVAEAAPIAAALRARAAALTEAGFTVQVHVRPDAPLPFVHPDGPAGPRFRIAPAPGGFALLGSEGTLPAATLAGWLADDPARLSTSALLRPILQDTWLPTAAYVGGPGEIAYFAQLEPLYRHFGLPMPLVVARTRFRVIDDRAARLLAQLDLAATDAARPPAELLALASRAAPGQPDPDGLAHRWLAPVTQELAAFAAATAALDKGLAQAIGKAERAVTDQLERLADRYRRTLARHDDVTGGRVARLLDLLMPEGTPQERVYGWPWYAARYGIAPLTRAVLDGCAPLSPATVDLTL